MSLTVRRARPDELPACHAVRHEVFVVGQQVPLADDLDGLDAAALHLLALDGDTPVGTCRMRDHDGHAKVERVAVREAYRGRKLGVALMERLHEEAAALGYDLVTLHAQLQVVPFYEALGYEGHGEHFLDAGIWHIEMSRRLG